MRMFGGTGRMAVRTAGVALAFVAGIGLLSGCSNSTDTTPGRQRHQRHRAG